MCEITKIVATVSDNQLQVTLEIEGDADCPEGSTVDIEGPRESVSQTWTNAGTVDGNARFSARIDGSKASTPVRAGWSYRVIVKNPDGTECCRSGFEKAAAPPPPADDGGDDKDSGW